MWRRDASAPYLLRRRERCGRMSEHGPDSRWVQKASTCVFVRRTFHVIPRNIVSVWRHAERKTHTNHLAHSLVPSRRGGSERCYVHYLRIVKYGTLQGRRCIQLLSGALQFKLVLRVPNSCYLLSRGWMKFSIEEKNAINITDHRSETETFGGR